MFRRVFVLAVVLLALARQGALGQANLVFNGDFAQAAGARPAGWKSFGDAKAVDQALDVTVDDGHRCARLRCTRIDGEGGDKHAMLAQVGRVKLEQGHLYRFSCLAREEGIKGRSVSVAISDTAGWEPCGLRASLALERRWKPFHVVFRATRSVEKTGRLQIWFTETGALYVAEVRIEPVDAARSEFTDVVPSAGGRNLVPNGAFAVGAAGWSSLGIPAAWGNLSRLHGQVVPKGGPGGGPFLRIPLGAGRTPTLYFDYYVPSVTPQTRPLAASRGWIAVEPGVAYTVSCSMRSNPAGAQALVGVVEDPGEGGQQQRRETRAALSSEWQQVACTFTPTKRYVYVVAGPIWSATLGWMWTWRTSSWRRAATPRR